jgi:hypothetical protein
VSANTASTGDEKPQGYASDAVLPADSSAGRATDVAFAWLLVTDYELRELASGVVVESIARQARRLAEELAVKLQRNAQKPLAKSKKAKAEAIPSHVRTDRGGLEFPE